MIRKISCLLICLLNFVLAYGQDSTRLSSLLQERRILHQEYVYLNAQNSNFWGKKSKKDLLKIIDSLKEIIRKDSEIIREIDLESLKKQALVTVEKERLEDRVIGDNQVVNNTFYELKAQLNSLQNLQKVKQKELRLAQEQAAVLTERKTKYDQMLVVCILIILGLLFYIFTLQRRLSNRKT